MQNRNLNKKSVSNERFCAKPSAEDVADPVGLFKWLVKGRHWNHLTDSNDDLARTFKLDLAGLLKPAPADAPPPRNVETIRKLAEGAR